MTTTPSGKPMARKVAVDADEAGRRIDNYLGSQLRNVPKTRIYRMLRQGEVRVNGSRVRPDHRLQVGDVVRIPPVWEAEHGPPPAVAANAYSDLEKRILHEDDDLLVLNKPAGLAVHGGSGLTHGLINILRQARPQDKRLELAHRLDRDTSGCLVLARNLPALQRLHADLRRREAGKDYLALVRGRLRGRLEIDQPLRKTSPVAGERRVQADAAGKEAVTRLQCRRRYREATLVDVELVTGRTHQIRVHAADAGYPLAGDRKYGDPEFNRCMRSLGLQRLFLHAASLELPGFKLKISAPLPDELDAVLQRLTPV